MIMMSEAPAENQAISVYEPHTLYQVPLDRIRENPDQPRKTFDDQALAEMVASVKQYGIVQPVIFRPGPDGTAVIVAGERRIAAARQVGLAEIPGVFIDGNAAEIALVENLQRQDLTAIEEAEALGRLMTEQQYTQEQLGGVIGKAQNTLSEILSLNKLPQEIRDDCRGDRTISKNTLITIARKKQSRAMAKAYNNYKVRLQQGKPARKTKDPNDPQTLCDMIEKATAKIGAVNSSVWTDEDKTHFRAALTNLKTEIDAYLNVAPPAARPT